MSTTTATTTISVTDAVVVARLTWDAGMKYTGVKLELITDYDMILFLDRGMYGGVSFVGRCASISSNKTVYCCRTPVC